MRMRVYAGVQWQTNQIARIELNQAICVCLSFDSEATTSTQTLKHTNGREQRALHTEHTAQHSSELHHGLALASSFWLCLFAPCVRVSRV